jgi:hypothetical protein
MPTTTRFGISYPAGSAAPNVPLSMQTQAESVEAALNTFPYKIAAGSGTITMGAGVAFVLTTISLPAGFTAPPTVTVTMSTTTGGRASLLQLATVNPTTTTFQIRVYTSDNANVGTSYVIGFSWMAVQMS